MSAECTKCGMDVYYDLTCPACPLEEVLRKCLSYLMANVDEWDLQSPKEWQLVLDIRKVLREGE